MKIQMTNNNIDEALEAIDNYLSAKKHDRKELIKLRLRIEEALMKYKAVFGEDCRFEYKCGKTLGKSRIRLIVEGESLDPFAEPEDDEYGVLMRAAFSGMGLRPIWKYSNGKNTVDFSIENLKFPDWLQLLITIGAGVLAGFLIHLIPDKVNSVILYTFLEPALSTFLGLLNAVAGPLIFFSVVWGIFSMGDAETFQSIGRKVSLYYFVSVSVLIAAAAAVILPFFRLSFGSGKTGNGVNDIVEIVFDIVPDNVVNAFSAGNTLQILFIAIIFGVAMIGLSEKVNNLASVLEQANYAVIEVMRIICKLLYLFIFGSLVKIIAESEFAQIAAYGKFFLMSIVACIFIIIVSVAVVCIRFRLPPTKLCRKTVSSFMIALTTSSSAAAFPYNMKCCIEELGIDKKLTNFGVALGQVVYMPGVGIVLLCGALSVAEFSGMQISVAWLFVAWLVSVILSIASPAVPGGSTSAFTVLFMQLGLPSEYLAMILALNVILDFLHTATNIISGQCVLLLAGDSANLVDKNILRK